LEITESRSEDHGGSFLRSAAIVLAFMGVVLVMPIEGSSGRQAVDTTIPTNRDWTRFGWDAARSNASLAPSDIAAANIATRPAAGPD
jgi:hypothetical protein